MTTHSSILAWRIPGTVEPVGLPSMGLHRVGHDWSDLAAARRNIICSFDEVGCGYYGSNLPPIYIYIKYWDTIAWCNLWLFPKDFYSALREVRFRVQNLTRRCHIRHLILKLFSVLYGFDWLTHPPAALDASTEGSHLQTSLDLSTQSKSLLDYQTVEFFTS